MSPSDTREAIAVLEQVAADALSADDVRRMVSVVTRLYASASTRADAELAPLTADVSTTDALTLACALVRSQDLTPFEMAMWFSRGGSPGPRPSPR
jgi:hypothetical protein